MLLGGVSAFGISGTNACAILSTPIDNAHIRRSEQAIVSFSQSWPLHVLPVSARSKASLDAILDDYQEWLKASQRCFPVSAICAAAALCRKHFAQHRAAIIFQCQGKYRIFRAVEQVFKAEKIDDAFYQRLNSLLSNNSLHASNPELPDEMALCVAKAYLSGSDIHWTKIYPICPVRSTKSSNNSSDFLSLIKLPNYHFDQSRRYWISKGQNSHFPTDKMKSWSKQNETEEFDIAAKDSPPLTLNCTQTSTATSSEHSDNDKENAFASSLMEENFNPFPQNPMISEKKENFCESVNTSLHSASESDKTSLFSILKQTPKKPVTLDGVKSSLRAALRKAVVFDIDNSKMEEDELDDEEFQHIGLDSLAMYFGKN